MGIDWDKHLKEKKEIKLKYLELLKERFSGKEFNLREIATKWAIDKFPYLKVPKKQFAGTFDHSGWGFFITEHNFLVTQKEIKNNALSRGISPVDYINELLNIVQDDRRL